MAAGVVEGAAGELQQGVAGRVGREVEAQGQGVVEGADEACEGRVDTVAAAQADDQIALAAVALQQGGEGSQQHGLQIHAVAVGQAAQTGGEVVRQIDGQAGAGVGLDGRAGQVGGQFEHRCRAGQAAAPVGEVLGVLRVVALGVDEVGETRAGRLVGQRAGEVGGDLVQQQAEAFFVEEVAVGHQQQDVLVGADAQQVGAQHGLAGRVEGGAAAFGDPAGAGVFAGEAVEGQRRAGGHAGARAEAALENVMTGANAMQRRAQGIHVKGAGDGRADGMAVLGMARIGLFEEPVALLGVRPGRSLVVAGFRLLDAAATFRL